MVVSNEKDRDNWIRLTLRLPPDVHAKVVKEAGLVSLNTAIVQLLEAALLLRQHNPHYEIVKAENAETSEVLLGEASLLGLAEQEAIEKLTEEFSNKLQLITRAGVEKRFGKRSPLNDPKLLKQK